MAGNFAKIYKTVWADADFRKLTRGQQWLYWALCSQPEINFAGVVTTTERRLTGCAADFTLDELREDLEVLEKRDYVVVDEEHDEILVRTYIKWDDAWHTPNVLVGILRAAIAVRSPAIRARLADELARLDVKSMDGKRADEMRKRVAEALRTLTPRVPGTVPARVEGTVADRVTEKVPEGLAEPFGEPLPEPLTEPTVVVAVVVEELKDRTSVDLVHTEPDPPDPVADGDGVLIPITSKQRKPEPGSDDDPHFVAFWRAYPRKKGKPSARTAWKRAIKRTSPEALVAASQRFRDDPERERVLRYVPLPATWLNDDRWDTSEEDAEDEHHDDPNQRYALAAAAAERAPGEYNHGR